MWIRMRTVLGAACFGMLAASGVLLVAQLEPASAGASVQTYETYKGARHYARARARKVCSQERNYRASEWKRLARLGVPAAKRPPPWSYTSPWGPCTAPGLF